MGCRCAIRALVNESSTLAEGFVVLEDVSRRRRMETGRDQDLGSGLEV